MIELIDIRVFTKISELMSISSVARVLNMQKSTVSRSLARLESALGVALIYRSNRKLLLTDTGALFAESARRILEHVEDAERKIGQIRHKPCGLLRVSATMMVGQHMIAPLVTEFLRLYPEVQISLMLTSDKIELLVDEIDVAIRVGPLEDSQLVARRLGSAKVMLFSTVAYLSEHGTPASPCDLSTHTLLDIADGPREWTLHNGKESTTVQVHPRFFANDVSSIRTVLLSGLGLGWLPDYLCRQDVADGRLVRVLPDWDRGAREAHAVFLRHRMLSPKVRSFVDFLVDRINT